MLLMRIYELARRASRIVVLLTAGLLPGELAAGAEEAPARQLVYLGTYTRGGESEGIYVCELDLRKGTLAHLRLAAKSKNPSFLALHPSGRFLYSVSEIADFEGKKTGAVSSFALDPKSGALKFLNKKPSGGGGPCHLVVDHGGKNVLVANYGGGSVNVLGVGADGLLADPTGFVQHKGSSVNPRRQKGPHAHSINLDGKGAYAFAADLGLDKILVYRFNPVAGTLTPNKVPSASVSPGGGPRHFAFHPGGKFAYVINEMASTVTAFSYQAKTGNLSEIQTVTTLPSGFSGNSSTAEVQVSPDGKLLFGSNRGHDSIAIFSIDSVSGRLTVRGHQATGGRTPRNFGVDPTGRFLLAANQSSDTVVVFRIGPAGLTPTGSVLNVPRPVCVKFLPAAD